MIIDKNIVVLLEYKLSDSKGTLIDSSEFNGHLSFIQGVGMMMPGIEKAIQGKDNGFEYSGEILPEDAYGIYKPENVFPAPKSHFDHLIDQMEEGKLYNFDTGGGTQMLKVVKIDENIITLDANHPYAGETLKLQCKVLDTREATEEELAGRQGGCGCGSSKKSGGCCSTKGSGEKKSGGCCSTKKTDEKKSGGCCKTKKKEKSGCGCS